MLVISGYRVESPCLSLNSLDFSLLNLSGFFFSINSVPIKREAIVVSTCRNPSIGKGWESAPYVRTQPHNTNFTYPSM